ncbi:MAG: hypothetical protein IPN20_17345 [Haliscomenobacter sp.]|nr:hypothetical protein [Haliscomenobacter sp.]
MFRLFFLFLVLLAPDFLAGQCDNQITPADNAVLRYKYRGNRCEGFYRSKVSAKSLALVSCTLGEFRFKSDPEERITLQVASEKAVNIRAQGIPIDLYYRMDASLEPDQKLEWDVASVLLKDSKTAKLLISDYSLFGNPKATKFLPGKSVPAIPLKGPFPDGRSIRIKIPAPDSREKTQVLLIKYKTPNGLHEKSLPPIYLQL